MITFKSGTNDDVVDMKFEVTDLREDAFGSDEAGRKGTVVMVVPERSQKYIFNLQTGNKITTTEKCGASVTKPHFLMGIYAGNKIGRCDESMKRRSRSVFVRRGSVCARSG